jgi:hypothetical protein
MSLKPCPFCGVAAEIEPHARNNEIIATPEAACYFIVGCVSGACKVMPMLVAWPAELERIVAEWNTRAPAA